MGIRLPIIAGILGIVVGLVTIYVLPSEWEILLWIILAIGMGFAVSRLQLDRYFRFGFWNAVFMGVCITLMHLVLVGDYLASHLDEQALLVEWDLGVADWVVLLMVAPVYWLVFGLMAGGGAALWGRILRK